MAHTLFHPYRFMTWFTISLLVVFAAGIGCSSSAEDEPDWTIMVYMDADNNLEKFAIKDIQEMMRAGSSDNLNIIVLIDRVPGESDESLPGLGNFLDSRVLRILPDDIEYLGSWGEVNMGDPAVLSEFIEYAGTNFPARHYMLDIWNHGGGVSGVAWDDSNDNDNLKLPELAEALEDGLSAASIGAFDIIGFDACLMASVEVANAVEPYARFMLASEEVEPGHGWDYSSLTEATEHSSTTAKDLATALAHGFIAQAENAKTSPGITISLVDLDQLHNLLTALSDFVAAVRNDWGSYTTLAFTLAGHESTRFGKGGPMVDLMDLITNVGLNENQQLQKTSLLNALNDVVTYKHCGTKFSSLGGLSIYMPDNQKQPSSSDLSKYSASAAGSWDSLIEDLYSAQDEDDEAPIIIQDDIGLAFDGDLLVAECDLDQSSLDDLIELRAYFGILDGEDVYFFWDLPARVDEEGHVTAEWKSPSVSVVSDGINATWTTLQIYEDLDAGVWYLEIPMAYESEADADLEQVSWFTSFDDASGEVIASTFYSFDESGAVGELAVEEGSLLYGELLVSSSLGQFEYVAFEPGLDPYAEWNMSFEEFESGTTLVVDIVAVDVGGNITIIESTIDR